MTNRIFFGVDKKLEVSTIIDETPTYKCTKTQVPVFDLKTNVTIGSRIGETELFLDANGKVLLSECYYKVTFSPDTNIKGVASYSLVYTSDQLLADGEELDGTYFGNIDNTCSSGHFLGWEGLATEVKTGDICAYELAFYSNVVDQ
jgi:hypothetical protein